MDRYIVKSTGNKLVRWHSVPIFCSSSYTEFGDLYWDITAQQWIVIAAEGKYMCLDIDENPHEVDLYAISKASADHVAEALDLKLRKEPLKCLES